MPRLLHELAVGRDGSYTRLLARLAKLDLFAIDDWMLAPLRDTERRGVDERHDRRRRHTLEAAEMRVNARKPPLDPDRTITRPVLDCR